MNHEIYLDNSATTKPYDEVIDFMNNIYRNTYGNPSSMHTKGIEAEKLVKAARSSIAKYLNADPKEIYFTSGGTESNNMAIKGYLEANPRKGKHIITTKIEHPSVLEVYKHLESSGYKVDYLSVNQNGEIILDELKDKICEETSLISIILVNNETGTIQPLEEIVSIIKANNSKAVLHIDAVQAFGKIQLSPKKSGIDMMSISSHKIHGPKGVGALYVNKSIKIKPILQGGGQESLMRSGTENVPGICGFGMAAEITCSQLDARSKNAAQLKKAFIDKLADYSINYRVLTPENSSPFILNIGFPGLRSEVLLHHLEERKIFVSTGSACSSRKNIRSHVLTAMGLPADVVDGAIRFSFSVFNDIDDINNAVIALEEIIPRILIKKDKKQLCRNN